MAAETRVAPTALGLFILGHPAFTRWANLWRTYGATEDERLKQFPRATSVPFEGQGEDGPGFSGLVGEDCFGGGGEPYCAAGGETLLLAGGA